MQHEPVSRRAEVFAALQHDWQPTMRLRLYRARPWHAPRLQQLYEDHASTAAVWPIEWRDVPIVDDP